MSNTSTLTKVSASGRWESGVKTSLTVRHFKPFLMDEPIQLGGTDEAPNPMEFVLAALNGCKSVMISVIAKEIDFSFSAIEFDSIGFIDIRGLSGVEGVSPHFQKVRFSVNIKTNESDERIQQLKEIVEKRCPVYNLLNDAGILIDAEWARI